MLCSLFDGNGLQKDSGAGTRRKPPRQVGDRREQQLAGPLADGGLGKELVQPLGRQHVLQRRPNHHRHGTLPDKQIEYVGQYPLVTSSKQKLKPRNELNLFMPAPPTCTAGSEPNALASGVCKKSAASAVGSHQGLQFLGWTQH